MTTYKGMTALKQLARVSAANMDDAEVHPKQLLELIEAAEENTRLKRERDAAYRKGLDVALGEAQEWVTTYDNQFSGTPVARNLHYLEAAKVVASGIVQLITLHDDAVAEQDALAPSSAAPEENGV